MRVRYGPTAAAMAVHQISVEDGRFIFTDRVKPTRLRRAREIARDASNMRHGCDFNIQSSISSSIGIRTISEYDPDTTPTLTHGHRHRHRRCHCHSSHSHSHSHRTYTHSDTQTQTDRNAAHMLIEMMWCRDARGIAGCTTLSKACARPSTTH